MLTLIDEKRSKYLIVHVVVLRFIFSYYSTVITKWMKKILSIEWLTINLEYLFNIRVNKVNGKSVLQKFVNLEFFECSHVFQRLRTNTTSHLGCVNCFIFIRLWVQFTGIIQEIMFIILRTFHFLLLNNLAFLFKVFIKILRIYI
jgi:hypothetical protein